MGTNIHENDALLGQMGGTPHSQTPVTTVEQEIIRKRIIGFCLNELCERATEFSSALSVSCFTKGAILQDRIRCVLDLYIGSLIHGMDSGDDFETQIAALLVLDRCSCLEEPVSDETIRAECERVGEFLVAKNRSYGASAFALTHCFDKSLSLLDRINVRLDDKISRLMHGNGEVAEDTELDIIGYIVLKSVVRRIIRNGDTET